MTVQWQVNGSRAAGITAWFLAAAELARRIASRCGDSVLEPECGLVSGQQNASCAQEVVESVGDLVAGAGFEPATFRL